MHFENESCLNKKLDLDLELRSDTAESCNLFLP